MDALLQVFYNHLSTHCIKSTLTQREITLLSLGKNLAGYMILNLLPNCKQQTTHSDLFLWWSFTEQEKKRVSARLAHIQDRTLRMIIICQICSFSLHTWTESESYILLGYFYLESFTPLLSSLSILQHQFGAGVYSTPVRNLIVLQNKCLAQTIPCQLSKMLSGKQMHPKAKN